MKPKFSRARYFSHAALFCAFGSALLVLPAPSQAASTTLTVSGTPPASVTLPNLYSFQPVVTDTKKSLYRFNVYNKPVWAQFDGTTGRLWGRPNNHEIGTYRNITIRVTDWYGFVTTAPFTISVVEPASVPTNTPPTISGHAPTAVNVGTAYNFAPVASDADKNTLSFSIKNQPRWANFNATSGTLSGTPSAADVGTYANVQISVSDGKASAALPAFTIAVNQMSAGNAVLDWTPPTQNTDGTVLTNLAGYTIHYGTSPDSLAKTIEVTNPGLTSYVVENLATGTWYFAITSHTSNGMDSSKSGVVSTPVL
jgi:hypothetical protein